MDYLVHHGILGMKWGIRRYQNKDGTLTPAGRNHLKQKGKNVQQMIKDSAYNEDISDKVFDEIDADEKYLNEARKEINEGIKVYKDVSKQTKKLFRGLEIDKEYYEAISEIANDAKLSGKSPKQMTMEELCWAAYMGIFEDGGQGNINAYSLYANKKNIIDKVKELDLKTDDAYKLMKEKASNNVLKAFEDVGMGQLTASENTTCKAGKMIVDQMINSKTKSIDDRTFTLGMANYKFDSTDTKNVNDVISIASKMYDNKSDINWYFLNEATEKLNLDQKLASELTDSDWKNINNEIYKLRASAMYDE